MRQKWTIGVIVLVTLAGGLVLGFLGLQQPATPNVGSRDEIQVWATEENASFNLRWALSPTGQVTLTIDRLVAIRDDYERTAIVVLACGARLKDVRDAPTYNSRPERTYSLVDYGVDSNGCDTGMGESAYQLLTISLNFEEGKAITGTPYADWQNDAGGRRVARSPYLSALAVEPPENGTNAPPLAFSRYPELATAGAEDPIVGFTVILQSHVSEVRENLDAPAGAGVTERQSNVPLNAERGEPFVESVTWQSDEALQLAGARWSDPSGQVLAQWFLLLSGVLLGVAVSLVMEVAVTRLSASRT